MKYGRKFFKIAADIKEYSGYHYGSLSEDSNLVADRGSTRLWKAFCVNK